MKSGDFKKKFIVAGITVHCSENIIFKDNAPITLQPKLMQLLCFFAEHAGEVITRKELLAAVWPEVVVSDEAVTRSIFLLRSILGDNAKEPRFIQTISKKGYRFLPDIQYLEEKPGFNSRLMMALMGLSMIIMVGVIMGVYKKKIIEDIHSIIPITQQLGSEAQLALHPDGFKIAYVHKNEWRYQLLVKDISGAELDTVLPNTSDLLLSPRWLNAKTLAYIQCGQGGCDIVRQTFGSDPVILYQSSHPLISLSYAEKNDTLFFNEKKDKERIELKSLRLQDGLVNALRDRYPDLPKSIRTVRYNSESDALYFSVDDHDGSGVMKLDMEAGELTRVISGFASIESVDFMNAQHMVVAGTRGATHGIWLARTNDSNRLLLRASGNEQFSGIIFDSIKRRLFYTNTASNQDIFYMSAQGIEEFANLNSIANESSVVFSSIDDALYFVSNRTGYDEVWRYDRVLQQAFQVTHLKASHLLPPIISEDGEHMVVSFREKNIKLAVIRLSDGSVVVEKILDSVRYPLSWGKEANAFYASVYEGSFKLLRYDSTTLEERMIHEHGWLQVHEHDDGSLVFADHQLEAIVKKDVHSGDISVISQGIPGLNTLSLGELSLGNEAAIAITKTDQVYQINHYVYGGDEIEIPSLLLNRDMIPPRLWVSDVNDEGTAVLLNTEKRPNGNVIMMNFE